MFRRYPVPDLHPHEGRGRAEPSKSCGLFFSAFASTMTTNTFPSTHYDLVHRDLSSERASDMIILYPPNQDFLLASKHYAVMISFSRRIHNAFRLLPLPEEKRKTRKVKKYMKVSEQQSFESAEQNVKAMIHTIYSKKVLRYLHETKEKGWMHMFFCVVLIS